MKTFYQRAPAVSLHLQKPGKTRVDELVASRIWEHVPSNLPLFFSPLLIIKKDNRPDDCRLVGSCVLLNKALTRIA